MEVRGLKIIRRGNRVFYRVGRTTVCFYEPYKQGFMFLYGAPGGYSNLGVICGTEDQAKEKARKVIEDRMDLMDSIRQGGMYTV